MFPYAGRLQVSRDRTIVTLGFELMPSGPDGSDTLGHNLPLVGDDQLTAYSYGKGLLEPLRHSAAIC
jgi:hypothetical protein